MSPCETIDTDLEQRSTIVRGDADEFILVDSSPVGSSFDSEYFVSPRSFSSGILSHVVGYVRHRLVSTSFVEFDWQDSKSLVDSRVRLLERDRLFGLSVFTSIRTFTDECDNE